MRADTAAISLVSQIGLATLPLAASGCLTETSCDLDADCESGVCASTHECLRQEDVRRVELRWTIDGAPVAPDDPAGCDRDGIGRLTVSFTDFDTADAPLITTFDPVPCALGKMVFIRLPTWYDTADLTAWSADDRRIANARGTLDFADTPLTLDLVTAP